jgi:hypothetical protein
MQEPRQLLNMGPTISSKRLPGSPPNARLQLFAKIINYIINYMFLAYIYRYFILLAVASVY